MKFQKGHKLAKGGRREGAGRPTREQAAEKESFRQALERKREAKAGILADKYYEMALNDPATMRHLVDKVIPPMEKVEHSGKVGVRPWVIDAYEPKKKK